MSDSENSKETVEAPAEAPAVEEPVVEKVVEKSTAPTKGTECGHPSNGTGYHAKGIDGTCIYCGQ